MSRSTQELLSEVLIHLELASEYASNDAIDQLVIDAICMRLSAGIEVLARLELDVRTNLFGDNWVMATTVSMQPAQVHARR